MKKHIAFLTSLIFFLMLSLPLNASGRSTEEELKVAKSNLVTKNYHEAISQTKALLESLTLDTVEKIILAHKILGTAYCEIGEQEKSIDHFRSLITFSPREDLEGFAHSGFCREMYADLQTGGSGQVKPVETQKLNSQESEDVVQEIRGETWERYIPFGYGQFQNGEKEKGWGFLSGESLSIVGGLTSYFLFRSERNSDGSFKNSTRASIYRGMFWSFTGVGAGIAVWGIIDAVLTHKRMKRNVALSETGLFLEGPMLVYRF